MDVVAGSQNDEFYTPEYAIIPLLKYLRKHSIIWCPFDTRDSNFVKILERENYVVMSTHLSEDKDFFEVCDDYKDKCDYIISNPPYSKKGQVIKELFGLGKPFAMLVGVVGLFESKERFRMFKENDFEIMYFDKRISYFKSFEEQKPSLNPPFSSVYVCKNVLPKQIIFEEVNKKVEPISQKTLTEDGIPPKPKGLGILPTIL